MGDSKALEALFPGPKRIILSAIFGEPDRWWSLAELAANAGLQPGAVRRYVLELRHGGLVRYKRDEGRTWFQSDPACPVSAELRSIVGKLTKRPEDRKIILVVEDQPATARITRILLESWGYHVLEAHCARDAIRIFEENGARVHLLLTDVIMPEKTGPQLADELRSRKPDLRVVFMSGYPSDELAGRDASFLPKPFNPASLSHMVRQELERGVNAL